MNQIKLVISPPGRSGFSRSFMGPAGWDQVTPGQAIGLLRLQIGVQQLPELLFPALTLIYGIKSRHQRWLFDERFLRRKGVAGALLEDTLELGQKLIDTIRWSGEVPPGSDFIVKSFRLLDFRYGSPGVLLRRLIFRQRYQAPADALADLRFAEFMLADKAYRDKDYSRLAAILYVPFHKKNRPAVDQQRIDARAQLFEQIEPALAQLIALQFESSLAYLQQCFTYVFPKNQTNETQDVKNSGNTKSMWLEVAINMAKLDATKISAIEDLNLYLALKVLDVQIRQAEELEEQMESIRK